MKKSFRLLSVLLAFVLAFSSLSAVASAAETGSLRYNSTTTYEMTGEEGAAILLDYVDALLAEKGGVFKMSELLADMDSGLSGALKFVMSADVENLEIDYTSLDSAISDAYDAFQIRQVETVLNALGDAKNINVSALKGLKRSKGDLNFVYGLLQFLADNTAIFQKVIKGNLSLGLVDSFFNVNDEIKKAMDGKDIPTYLTSLVYTQLLYKLVGDKSSAAYPEAMPSGYTLDRVLQNFVNEYLTAANNSNGNKVILPSLAGANLSKLSISQSAYLVLKNCIAAVYEDMGRVPLNNDVKEGICNLCDIKLTKVEDAALLATLAADPANLGSKTAFANCDFFKAADGNYYLRKNETYSVADLTTANSLAAAFNLDYNFAAGHYDFDAGYATYGSILGQFNDLLGTLLGGILAPAAVTAVNWQMGGNDKLIANLTSLCRYILPLCPAKFFPDGFDMTAINAENVKDKSLEELLYLVLDMVLDNSINGLDFPDDMTSLPQLLAVLVNFYIVKADPSLDASAKIYDKDGKLNAYTYEQWADVILSMGIDTAVYYLDLNTNFDLDKAAVASYKAKGWGTDQFLDEIVDWAIAYLGKGVFAFCDKFTDAQIKRGEYKADCDGWYKLNVLLNGLLPFEFIQGAESADFTCDFEKLLKEVAIPKLISADANAFFNLVAPNKKAGNILNDSLVTAILKIVQKPINAIFPNAISNSYLSSGASFISADSLSSIIGNLIGSLNSRKAQLLPVLVPFVLGFLPDIVGTQRLIVSTGLDKDNNLINITTKLYQPCAEMNFSMDRKTVFVGDTSSLNLKLCGVIVAKTAYLKSKGITAPTTADVDGVNIRVANSPVLRNENANTDGSGYYYFSSQLVGLNKLTADDEVTVVSYTTYIKGDRVVSYYSDPVFCNFDYANV